MEAVKKEIFRGRRLVSINYIITYKMNRPLGDAFKRKSIWLINQGQRCILES